MDWGLAKLLARDGATPAETAAAVRTVRTAGPDAHSQAGRVVGTPAYMPPEQATGAVEPCDERADVFGLSAILCEILTGQPPYVAPSGADLLALAAAADLEEAYARLETCGADAELVWLAQACLTGHREARPRDAAAVAAAVTAYQEGVDLRLRRAELERARAEVRAREARARRRLALALVVAVFGLVVVGGVGLRLWYQQVQARQAVEQGLSQAEELCRQARWADAEVARARADSRLGEAKSDELRGRLEQARADLALVQRLEDIRLNRVPLAKGSFDTRAAARDYPAAFAAAGLRIEGADPAAVVARLRGSAIREPLVAALDDWALVGFAGGDAPLQSVLLGLARAADPDDWRDRLRDPAAWRDRAALERLALEAGSQPPQLLTVLGELLQRHGADAGPLLRAAQARHPADVWLNFRLGELLFNRNAEEAAGFCRAALALRPHNPAVRLYLGWALHKAGRLDDALAQYREAVRVDPQNAQAHNLLGYALYQQGHLDEAIACYREALRIDPMRVHAHNDLGIALGDQGRLDEALACFRQALRINPRAARVHHVLGWSLCRMGQLDEAIACYREALRLDPRLASAHNDLAVALKAQGRFDEAMACYREALRLDPRHPYARTNLGWILYLARQPGRRPGLLARGRPDHPQPPLGPPLPGLGLAGQGPTGRGPGVPAAGVGAVPQGDR